MIDLALDEPLALLVEAFGQEPNGAALLRFDREGAPTMTVPSAVVVAAAAQAETGIYAAHAD
ncbi:hypothetical protein [Methylobacterium gnaphalii]|uniref:Uncharacterized protein n=1 Tax=Methylobacterium gnaphalii TaxID=1010610 RepID=A0A512JDX8_9HYPH|nr:hypothetical protein [Methylobacterium gnaphalii]GEP08164.1 hypothetical protein MGN01_00090 [Methylobacterium gnaphalii]GJD68239.1 hypothetical protein MMMDOFMJ_1158 [Methylobacterium gnaphalii]GLS51205.1 hypothetical protein GCM10007885_40590 [Methylobacterium gnaphalii]